MATNAPNRFKYELLKGTVNFDGVATFKCALMNSSYVFDPDTHDLWADIDDQEITAGYGYTAGGQTLANVTVTRDDANNCAKVTADNVVWTAAGGAIGPSAGAIIYYNYGVTKYIVGYIDFSGAKAASDGGTFTITNIVIKMT